MAENRLVNIINTVYKTEGFQGVIEEIIDRLEYGTVKKMNGLYRISTGGWSEDELLLHSIIRIDCMMSKHYCGYIKGGAFYFCEDKYANVEMMRVYDYEKARDLGLVDND